MAVAPCDFELFGPPRNPQVALVHEHSFNFYELGKECDDESVGGTIGADFSSTEIDSPKAVRLKADGEIVSTDELENINPA